MNPKLLYSLIKIPLLLCLAGCLTSAFASDEPEPFNLTQVAQGNYLHRGVHVEFTHSQNDDIANIGFIIGNKCIAVIDTGGSVTVGQKLLSSIRGVSQLPVCYVINTHVHFDHLLGNLVFKNEDAQFVGHVQLADAVEQSRDFFLNQFRENLGPAPDENSIIGPDLTVDMTMDLDLGNRTIRLTAYQTAHSQSDLTVLDIETKTLWAGDLVFRERIPALDGKLKGWLAVLEDILKQNLNLIIPGHGTPGSDAKQTLSREKSYLQMLLDETRKAIKNGEFLEDAVNTIGQSEKESWLLHEQHHRSNITRAFIELEWE